MSTSSPLVTSMSNMGYVTWCVEVAVHISPIDIGHTAYPRYKQTGRRRSMVKDGKQELG